MKSTTEICLEILDKTNDGDNLSRKHLQLVESAINDNLNDLGIAELHSIHSLVTAGSYSNSGFCGCELMRIDHNGYVWFKKFQIEHFSGSLTDKSLESTVIVVKELEELCLKMEKYEIPINGTTAGFFSSVFAKLLKSYESGNVGDYLEYTSDIELATLKKYIKHFGITHFLDTEAKSRSKAVQE